MLDFFLPAFFFSLPAASALGGDRLRGSRGDGIAAQGGPADCSIWQYQQRKLRARNRQWADSMYI
eukprot:8896380-Alexandrium_andersonii.AAC.1